MRPSTASASAARIWLLPLSVLGSVCLALFTLTSLADGLGSGDPLALLNLAFRPDPAAAANTLANAGEIVAAVLAIALTVVAIIVELASNRYTHRVTELFVSEPINFAVMGLFVVTALQGMWVTMTFDQSPDAIVPYTGIAVTMGMLTACLLILLPYFNFVFNYLNPLQIVQRISGHTFAAIRAQRRGTEAAQAEAIRGIEQLADVALNAMEHRDKGISVAGINALRELVTAYQGVREELPPAWFEMSETVVGNPDFISMDPHTIDAVAQRRLWLEMKVLRQYQMIYGEALGRMRDLNYVIAINTQHMAEDAARAGNLELLHTTLKFYNSFVRAAINAKDVRSAYNVLNHYRHLGQSLLGFRDGMYAAEIARYFKYYGLLSYNAKLPFLLEVVAYDLCALTELAVDQGSPVVDELLRIFLRVDRESEDEAHDDSLRGVRKAQVKLATYFLLREDEARARQVFRDMADESPARLASIRDELFSVRSPEYWEITDRGSNFEYLEPERKRRLATFFSWFDNLPTKGTALVSQLPVAPGAELDAHASFPQPAGREDAPSVPD